jgi:hypothetical protein
MTAGEEVLAEGARQADAGAGDAPPLVQGLAAWSPYARFLDDVECVAESGSWHPLVSGYALAIIPFTAVGEPLPAGAIMPRAFADAAAAALRSLVSSKEAIVVYPQILLSSSFLRVNRFSWLRFAYDWADAHLEGSLPPAAPGHDCKVPADFVIPGVCSSGQQCLLALVPSSILDASKFPPRMTIAAPSPHGGNILLHVHTLLRTVRFAHHCLHRVVLGEIKPALSGLGGIKGCSICFTPEKEGSLFARDAQFTLRGSGERVIEWGMRFPAGCYTVADLYLIIANLQRHFDPAPTLPPDVSLFMEPDSFVPLEFAITILRAEQEKFNCWQREF